MKGELATAIGTAIVGFIAAYFVCNLFVGDIEPVTFNTVDDTVNTELANPDPEVFNYKALNPTVEVYVGDCTELDAAGKCIDQATDEGEK